jgi:hypothetical protein
VIDVKPLSNEQLRAKAHLWYKSNECWMSEFENAIPYVASTSQSSLRFSNADDPLAENVSRPAKHFRVDAAHALRISKHAISPSDLKFISAQYDEYWLIIR